MAQAAGVAPPAAGAACEFLIAEYGCEDPLVFAACKLSCGVVWSPASANLDALPPEAQRPPAPLSAGVTPPRRLGSAGPTAVLRGTPLSFRRVNSNLADLRINVAVK